jgi:large subunit ribosomal protein L29
MKYAEISSLSEGELRKQTKEIRAKMFEARMKNALGQLANQMEIRTARRDAARLQTAMTAQKRQVPAATSAKAKAKVKG